MKTSEDVSGGIGEGVSDDDPMFGATKTGG